VYCCVAATRFYLLINTHLGFAGLQAAGLTDSESGEDSADEPDESWFAEYVDRQPSLRGPITDFGQVKLYIHVSGPYC
jgi:hypothetical protein